MCEVSVDNAWCCLSDDIRCDRCDATGHLGEHQFRELGTADQLIPDAGLHRGPSTGDVGDPDGRRETLGDPSVLLASAVAAPDSTACIFRRCNFERLTSNDPSFARVAEDPSWRPQLDSPMEGPPDTYVIRRESYDHGMPGGRGR